MGKNQNLLFNSKKREVQTKETGAEAFGLQASNPGKSENRGRIRRHSAVRI